MGEKSKKTKQVNLFNKSTGNIEQYYFEQYKLYVELADRISQRRMVANSFYITTNSALIPIASWAYGTFEFYMYLIVAIGVGLSVSWILTIKTYSRYNSAKFHIIQEIENKLPLNLFEYEWKRLGSQNDDGKKKLFTISNVEKIVPFCFLVLYIVVLILYIYFQVGAEDCLYEYKEYIYPASLG